MTVVFGMGTRLRVHMRTTLENGVLRNREQPGRAENSFIDMGKLVIKTLSGCEASHCDKHQFCDKMTVSTWTIFELSLFEQSGRNEDEKWQFRKRTLLHLAVFHVAFEQLYESCWS